MVNTRTLLFRSTRRRRTRGTSESLSTGFLHTQTQWRARESRRFKNKSQRWLCCRCRWCSISVVEERDRKVLLAQHTVDDPMNLLTRSNDTKQLMQPQKIRSKCNLSIAVSFSLARCRMCPYPARTAINFRCVANWIIFQLVFIDDFRFLFSTNSLHNCW